MSTAKASVSSPTRPIGPTWTGTATALAALVAAVGAFVVNSLIAWLGRGALGVPAEFMALTPPVYGAFAVVGVVVGAIGWRIIVRRSQKAASVLRVLVPVVLLVSLVPDVLLLVGSPLPGTTTAGVVCLMLMHLGVAAVAVPAYLRFMPPRRVARAS